MTTTLETLKSCSNEDFLARIGHIYENNTSFVSTLAKSDRSFTSVTELHAQLTAIVDSSTEGVKLKLINDHPDLASKAQKLLPDSANEQSKAGLGSLTEEEFTTFNNLNEEYKTKFGFRFILAIKNASKDVILANFQARLNQAKDAEFREALYQISKIAWMRLLDTVSPNGDGFLTVHVLDTHSGTPAANMPLSLVDETGAVLFSTRTNSDGRINQPAMGKNAPIPMQAGRFSFVFRVDVYFAGKVVPLPGQPFLTKVSIDFGIDNPEQHYHVPLLVSPWSYSTYRGS